MKSCKYFFLLTLIIFISYSTNGFSSIWDYTVSYKDTTDDFNASRQKAMSINRYTALKAVIAKIISMSDFQVIDKLIGLENSYFFEDRLRIFNEQVIQDTYSVDVTYSFNSEKIISFLKQNGIPYVTNNLENKILIIPIFNNSFSTNNIWYRILTNNTKNNQYLSQFMVLKDTDIANEEDLLKYINTSNENKSSTLNIIKNPDFNNNSSINFLDSGSSEKTNLQSYSNNQFLNKLKKLYNVNDIIIAKIKVEDRLNDKNDKNIDSSYNESEQTINNVQTEESFDPNNKLYYLSLRGLNDVDFKEFPVDSLYDQIKNTIGFSEIDKKNKTIEVTEDKNFRVFKVNFSSLIDWISIYSYMKQIDGIEQVELSEIGFNYSIIKINYHGDLSEIIANAALHNIIIDANSSFITCKDFCY